MTYNLLCPASTSKGGSSEEGYGSMGKLYSTLMEQMNKLHLAIRGKDMDVIVSLYSNDPTLITPIQNGVFYGIEGMC